MATNDYLSFLELPFFHILMNGEREKGTVETHTTYMYNTKVHKSNYNTSHKCSDKNTCKWMPHIKLNSHEQACTLINVCIVCVCVCVHACVCVCACVCMNMHVHYTTGTYLGVLTTYIVCDNVNMCYLTH